MCMGLCSRNDGLCEEVVAIRNIDIHCEFDKIQSLRFVVGVIPRGCPCATHYICLNNHRKEIKRHGN